MTERTMKRMARVAAGLCALGMLAVPIHYTDGWGPVALGAAGFAACVGVAVFGWES